MLGVYMLTSMNLKYNSKITKSVYCFSTCSQLNQLSTFFKSDSLNGLSEHQIFPDVQTAVTFFSTSTLVVIVMRQTCIGSACMRL